MSEIDLGPPDLPQNMRVGWPAPPLNWAIYHDLPEPIFLGLALALCVAGVWVFFVAPEERIDMKLVTRALGRHLIATGVFLPLSVFAGWIAIRPSFYGFFEAFKLDAPFLALVGGYALTYVCVSFVDAGLSILRRAR